MARLIPRKQIEEQQNISGSLNIGQSVNVGNDAIISGSLFVSKSFFLGTNINDRSEITSSIYLTGSLVIDGLLQAASPNTILAITASNSLVSVDTFKYAGILARDFGANVPTLYVSSTDGNDANDGRSIQFPLRTIKRASQLATPGYDGRYGLDSGSLYNGYVIRVQAGTYLEDNPVILPKNATIWGSGLRITKILAKNKDQDLFWVNSGCYVAEVTVGGMRLWPDQINPERGFGFAFQPGAFITTSPYIQNCSQISNQENSFAELYENIPPGGGGLYVNGDVINPDSPLASMVLDAYTQISPNGVGCLVNGRGFIQLVSFFNNFSYYAIRVNNGGHATLNNSNISFGLYGMYASGSRLISGSGGDLISRNSIRSTWSCIVDVLHKGYPAGLPSSSILNTNAGIKVTSEPQFFLNAGHTASQADIDEVNADFTLISQIVENGTGNFPTLLAKSSNKGYGANSPFNILGGTQTTASIGIGAGEYELNHISDSFAALLGIFANGTGSYNYKSNTSASISVTGITPMQSTIVASDIITGSVSSSFETVINIIKNGLSKAPTVISNTNSNIIISDVPQFTTGESSSLVVVNSVSASFSIVYNILANGTGSSILDVPQNEKVEFNITNTNSSSFSFEEVGENPTITLFRGETYKFHLNAADKKGPSNYPFWIRTKPLAGISTTYDYNNGVINNGDSVGNITFTVPYNAPNQLYYVCENAQAMVGKFNIVNASTTPIDLIKDTLTYPITIHSSSIASNDVDIINAYDIISASKQLIQKETLAFVSSSWSSVYYNEASCSRDIAYIVDGVIKDLLYGGNEESIRSGLYYYLYPSQATGYEKSATLTGVKYASQLALNLIKNKTLVMPDSIKEAVAQCIVDNRKFVQKETIAYLSSSWSGGDGFVYNEASCSRDVGYILDAVATDLKYGGNERSITAGQYYYLYPSVATAAGVPSSAKQLEPTLNGVRFAAGVVLNLIKNKSFNNPIATTQSTIDLLKANKELIQNETIQYIGVAYPQLTYNTSKCRRDVGYIIDSVATDLLYGGNERSVIAGNNYYNYPSVATSVQKKETSAAIKYTKIISDYIVQNIILDTPKVVNNDEKGIKVTDLNNYTSSVSGSKIESNLISSSFTIVEGIIKRGLDAIPSVLAQNTNQNWGVANPLNVTANIQTTNNYVTPNEINTIDRNFGIVTNIIDKGISVEPVLTSSLAGLIKVTNNEQVTGSTATNVETASISSSFAYVANIISGGLGQIKTLVSNLSASIVVTNTAFTSSTAATGSVGTLISSSMSTITTIISGGLDVVPKLTSSLANNIKVTNTTQIISSSLYSGSFEDVLFVSSSIAIVTNIIKGGPSPAKGLHTSSLSTTNAIAAYQLLKQNIPFIQAETIAYLSSSWAGFQYDEVKCKRDIEYIVSGAAEDLIFNSNSASIVNGEFYFELPSPATDSQLNQTLDGINYASRLAQKLIQNIPFTASAYNNQNADTLLRNNKVFIQNETIAYMSSSWGSFDYTESKCRRDVGYIIDAVRTDIVYGGNERTIEAGRYYFLYPSQATDTQLQQTTDAINYASRLAQKVVANTTFKSANTSSLNASNLLSLNKSLIAAEVVEYVSSSWSGVQYNEEKCKRDVGYILDAVRTDLVYGGNERTTIAGQYYYIKPSRATVGGVPSESAQLDPTITGVNYASRLAQNIVLNKKLGYQSPAVLNARELVKANTTFIQKNTIEYISDTYPNLDYKVDKCYRDVRFIVDGVLTDLVYGGNERSLQSGEFYYKYPNKATDSQVGETTDAINFAKKLTKLIAIGGKAIEDGFDIVTNIISSGSAGYPTLISNTLAGIKATNESQFVTQSSVLTLDKSIVSSSFGNVINIIDKGVIVIPTIVSSTNKGVNILGNSQITSSITPSTSNINKVGNEFDIVMNIIENGIDSLPNVFTNTSSSIKVTNTPQFISNASISSTYITKANNSFDIVLDIVKNNTGSLTPLVKNVSGLVKLTNTNQYTSSIAVSSSIAKAVTGSFDKIINIVENGIGSLGTITLNGYSNVKVTNINQTTGNASTQTQVTAISESFSIVSNIIKNGTGSISPITYTTPSTDPNVLNAYNLLKANIGFIQSESIAYLSSSWSTFDYTQSKCERDIGLIVSGAAEDLLFGSTSASLVNGKYYYLYPSQATSSQLYQTLDGIKYASQLAQKVISGIILQSPTTQQKAAYDILINNKAFIQNETIAYVSSSWSSVYYNEDKCKRDVGYIVDAVATDIIYGGNQRTIDAGSFYYLYPSRAIVKGVPSEANQLDQTVTGIGYARDLADKLLRGSIFTKVSQNKLQAKELIEKNKPFIQNEVIAFVSHSWSGFKYNDVSCSRDVAYILDGVITDVVYGGNERSRQAGIFYYKHPSQATDKYTQLAPTLTGIGYSKGLTNGVLTNSVFASASLDNRTAYQLLVDNKQFIQSESIAYLNSAWSFFDYNPISCSRDLGYMVDAVATDILYGGNERAIEAGRYYYVYPSLATVDGDGDSAGQLGQTLDGVRYAKGIAQKIVANTLLKAPTQSEKAGYDLLINNKKLIQKETIAYISSSWSGIGNFSYTEASCSRDVAYIIDNVATDLLYGGNERSSKAGEYYYLYPSKATVISSISPDSGSQKGPTIDGITFAAGLSQTLISNIELVQPTDYVKSAVSLLKQNRAFIQNETIQYIDAFFPYLTYLREKCRRDVGYIVDGVATDLFYGGNQRSITSGDYYFRYPNKATTNSQLLETVSGIEYAKAVSKKVAQNIVLTKPVIKDNTSANIKATDTNQYTSSISVSTTEISKISSSFSIVTDIIAGGVQVSPTKVLNTQAAIKVSGLTPTTSSINGGSTYADLVTSSFNLVRDIIYYGEAGIPDALARNYDYGFQLATASLLHITSTDQIEIAGVPNASDNDTIDSAYKTIVDIVNNGTGSIPSIIENTSSSINVTGGTPYQAPLAGTQADIDKIANGFGIVMDIIKGNYPTTLVSNTYNGIKVTDTPQLISGSGAERLQAKLVSSSFAVVSNIILNGTGSQTYVAPSATANSNPKITSAYHLLLDNKQMIIDETIAYMSSSWSTFDYTQSKCERDLGYIINGAAYDLLYGGNSASFVNGKYYYDFPSQATGSQLDQTLTAIRYASGLAEKVVVNSVLTHISASAETTASYSSLIKNKKFIQNEVIAYISSSWSTSSFNYTEASCSRDVAYIVDAVATDLLYGGNERSYIAGDYYYRYPSKATDSQLQPTLDGIGYSKGVAMNVASNTVFMPVDAGTQFSYNILLANKEFIQNETIAFVNAKYPNLYYNQTKCRRDVGYIVDAVVTDLLYGGNERQSIAGEFYFKYPSIATDVQLIETTTAIDYARRLSLEIIQNNIIPTPEVISNTENNIKVTNATQIRGTGGTVTEASFISASISIVSDIVTYGSASLQLVTPTPYTTPSTDPNVLNAYNLLKTNIGFIQSESIAYLSSSWVTGSNSDYGFNYTQSKCERDIALIISGAAEDMLFGVNSASIESGRYYWLVPSQAPTGQIDQTLDGIFYASKLAQKIVTNTEFVSPHPTAVAVYNTLKANKEFIQAETIAYVTSSWVGLNYTESKCRRDVGLIVDAVATDILYKGNQRSATAGQYYFKYPSQATTGSQLAPTLNAIDYAGGTAKNVITNKTFVTASNSVSASVELLRNNRLFIQNETMAYLTASWSSFEYNKEKCKRDIGYIVDGVATDILYGGNERSVMSGDFYYKYPSKATLLGDGDGVGQLGQTLDGIIYASRIAQKVAQNTQFVKASLAVSASFDLLRKNKNFIAAETIAYVSSSWSSVYYNEASCSRDVKYIIDAASTDLLYGGTERAITAGTYYYKFPSKATKAGVPSEANQLDPTITGVKYGGRLASRVILNPTFQYPSQSAVYGKKLLVGNKKFIQKETLAFLSSSWSTLEYNEASCSRDLGFIVDAVATDLIYGGNERSTQAGSYYYLIPSVAIQPSYTSNGKFGQKKQTVDGINYAAGISNKLIVQTQLVQPSVKKKAAAERLLASKEQLKYQAISYTNGAFPYLVYNEASCSRDTGLIVDACVTDLIYGGNERGIAAASSYYTGQYGSAKAVTNSQLLETLETNRYLRTRAEFIVANAPLETFGSLIVATGIDFSYNGAGVTFKALPPNQGGNGVPNPDYYITELGGGRIYFTSGDQNGNFNIGTGLTINQATGTLVGRTFNKSLFALVTPYSLALQI